MGTQTYFDTYIKIRKNQSGSTRTVNFTWMHTNAELSQKRWEESRPLLCILNLRRYPYLLRVILGKI